MTELLPPPCEDLLSEQYRHIWCGDTDPTGRYVCRRVRDHRLDRHVARNGAGGIHQWPVLAGGGPKTQVDGDLRERTEASTDRLVQELLDAVQKAWDEADGLRASREAWAIEAENCDYLASKFLSLYDRLLTAAAKATGISVSPGPDKVIPALELLAAERATTQAEVARLTRERDDARADAAANEASLDTVTHHLAEALNLDEVPLDEMLFMVGNIVDERHSSVTRAAQTGLCYQELGRIPAGRHRLTIEVEVDDQGQIVRHLDVPGGVNIAGFWGSNKTLIESVPAPVSGSDTTADGGEGE